MTRLRDVDVLIAGAGPTGLMLAGELALAGTDVAIVEPRAGVEHDGARAGGLLARSIEILDQRGIADRFLAEGQTAQVGGFAWIPLDISDFPTRHPYGLALWQTHIERILVGWIDELGVPIHRRLAVTGLDQDREGVSAALSDGGSVRARYLVGCDGGRSVVRKAAGIDFPGWDATMSHLIAEAELAGDPPWGLRHDAMGIHAFSPMGDGKVRIMVTEQQLGRRTAPTLPELSAALLAVYGSDYGVHSPRWISWFTDMARQAATYRCRRVLLAGDAAHVHYPAGGQGLNTGLQDAVNLGWKLAQVVKGISPDSLLDSYHAERHPVGARVLRNTMAQVALLGRVDERTQALRETVAGFLAMDEPRRHVAAEMNGLGIRYDLGDGHPLLGRRMPDLDLVTTLGPMRLFALLHRARPVLLDFGLPGRRELAGWAERVELVDAAYDGAWDLPAIGAVTAPRAVLVRPDGHVAWVGERDDCGLAEALALWFGPPTHREA